MGGGHTCKRRVEAGDFRTRAPSRSSGRTRQLSAGNQRALQRIWTTVTPLPLMSNVLAVISMRYIFRSLAIALHVGPVFACEIELPDTPVLVKEASAIFAGTLVEEHVDRRESVSGTLTVFQTFTVDVNRIWKGNVPRRVLVSRMDVHEQCVGSRRNFKYQPGMFAPGSSLIIFAGQTGSMSYAMLPFGYWTRVEDLPSLVAAYGPGRAP
jgi:hypothetical protein